MIVFLSTQVVENSASNNHAVIVGDGSVGTTVVRVYDWGEYFASKFQKFEGILSHQTFNIKKDGSVSGRRFTEDEESNEVMLLNQGMNISSSLPDVLEPEGLSLTRQWYLYEQIREFCKDSCRDMVCPKPSACKPKSSGK